MSRRLVTSLCLLGVWAATAAPASATTTPWPDNGKRHCIYTEHRHSIFAEFTSLIGKEVDCALVFNDASTTWAYWAKPWFTTLPDPDLNWANWVAAKPGRQLIITQNLFPSPLNGTDWLPRGAAGEYEEHARTLARNLVAAGLGQSVIRLGHEANGDWYAHSLGTTTEEYALWAQFWRRTVLAMKSVPGAEFRFDWTINANYRKIPLDLWYPGDDVVDFVGIDAYDAGIPIGTANRWDIVYTRPFGIRDVLNFAKAHGKPLSIPEWGVADPSVMQAGGDDPAYVNGIADVVRDNNVAYQSYFFNDAWADGLRTFPLSLAAYKQRFVVGDAVPDPPTPDPGTTDPGTTDGGTKGGNKGGGGGSGGGKGPKPRDRATVRTTASAAARRLESVRVRSRGWSFGVRVTALGPGEACLVVVPAARAAGASCSRQGSSLALGRKRFVDAGAATLKVRSARRLRAGSRQSLAVVALFVPAEGQAVSSTRRVTLRVAR